MSNLERKIISLVALFVAAALLAAAVGVAAQDAAPQPPAGPQITGAVTFWNGHRLELKTPEGKIEKVAVNKDTERKVEIKVGTEVTVEYRRRISGFIIALRILPAQGAPSGSTVR